MFRPKSFLSRREEYALSQLDALRNNGTTIIPSRARVQLAPRVPAEKATDSAFVEKIRAGFRRELQRLLCDPDIPGCAVVKLSTAQGAAAESGAAKSETASTVEEGETTTNENGDEQPASASAVSDRRLTNEGGAAQLDEARKPVVFLVMGSRHFQDADELRRILRPLEETAKVGVPEETIKITAPAEINSDALELAMAKRMCRRGEICKFI